MNCDRDPLVLLTHPSYQLGQVSLRLSERTALSHSHKYD